MEYPREIREIEKLCKPIMEYLKQNQDPYTEIVVSMDDVKMKRVELSIPAERRGNYECQKITEYFKKD